MKLCKRKECSSTNLCYPPSVTLSDHVAHFNCRDCGITQLSPFAEMVIRANIEYKQDTPLLYVEANRRDQTGLKRRR